MKGKQRKEVLEGMLVDNTNTNNEMLVDNSNTKMPGTNTKLREESLVDKQVVSLLSCGENVGDEENVNRLQAKDEDSSEDSSEHSSSEDDEEEGSSSSDDDGDEEQAFWRQSHQYSPGGGQQYGPHHPSGFPGPSQFQNPASWFQNPASQFQNPSFPAHPRLPPHQFQQNAHYQNQWQQQQQQENLVWYQNWCASLQLQRQQVTGYRYKEN